MSRALGQPLVIDNRPGAGGGVGSEVVGRGVAGETQRWGAVARAAHIRLDCK